MFAVQERHAVCNDWMRNWQLPSKVLSNCVPIHKEDMIICTVAKELTFSNFAEKSQWQTAHHSFRQSLSGKRGQLVQLSSNWLLVNSMGLPANPWDCCQPLGYSKAKFQCGLLCQNHMMSVLFSPDQNNQSFRLQRMVSVSEAATSLSEVTYTLRCCAFPPRPRGLQGLLEEGG